MRCELSPAFDGGGGAGGGWRNELLRGRNPYVSPCKGRVEQVHTYIRTLYSSLLEETPWSVEARAWREGMYLAELLELHHKLLEFLCPRCWRWVPAKSVGFPDPKRGCDLDFS